MKTHCKYGHVLDELTRCPQLKLHRPNGRWYVMHRCRICACIENSIRWYFGKHMSNRKYTYRGAPITVAEIVRKVERRWRTRREKYEQDRRTLEAVGTTTALTGAPFTVPHLNPWEK